VDQFFQEMSRAAMADRLIALRPLDGLSTDDLTNGAGARRRRMFLNAWLRTSATLARTDTRLSDNLLYRGVRRLLRPKRAQVSDLSPLTDGFGFQALSCAEKRPGRVTRSVHEPACTMVLRRGRK
jgi:hypothetical protein